VTAVAFITGGASGIGAAIGKALARRGVDVVLADRQLELAQQVAEGIRQSDGRASAVELDVRDPARFASVVGETVARSGRIDYLFNNAGIGVAGDIAGYTLPDWYDVFDVNLRGVVHGIGAVYPVMRAQGSGHIINTASMAGLLPTSEAASYGATKHAVVGLSKTLRIEADLAQPLCDRRFDGTLHDRDSCSERRRGVGGVALAGAAQSRSRISPTPKNRTSAWDSVRNPRLTKA
jgi:NADP-dependent 3-hydroxy acid dehydrogenase YdfG